MRTSSLAADAYAAGWRAGWRPDPRLAIDEWADARRVLTAKTSAEPGRWRTPRFPFTRAIMQDLSPDSSVWRVVWMAARQLAKTEVILNTIGHSIECSPGPMLFVEPTVDMAKKVSRQRIAPMLEEIPELVSRVRPARSRDSGNTMFTKEFDDGMLIMTGANSSASLRSMPIRRLLADEVDEYPVDVDEHGDALSIAEACTANFPNRKVAIFGNPSIRGRSRIEKEYLRGDQRRYFVPCPTCGHMDFITWNGRDYFGAEAGTHHRIAWDKDGDRHLPNTAHMVCGNPQRVGDSEDPDAPLRCGARVPETAKTWMLEHGEWRATATAADGVTRSYHLSSLYTPAGFKSWADCSMQFLAAKNDPELLRSWVNETLGETWEERADEVKPESLMVETRHDRYASEVPAGCGVLVAGVDVQIDRLAYVVKGYGAGEESWLIEWQEIFGNPQHDGVWLELDNLIHARRWKTAGGRMVKVERTCVDSGYLADTVYAYCKPRLERGVFAVKGGVETGRPLVGIATVSNRYRTPLFVLCTDSGKATVVARLRIATPGPGYVHLPAGIDPEYILQLTAERAVYKWSQGRTVRAWHKTRERNEAFDLEVYSLAALKMMGAEFIRGLADRAAVWATKVSDDTGPAAPATVAPRARRGWVSGWRR